MDVEFSREERVELARILMEVFDHWKIPPAQQVSLMGMEGKIKPRVLVRYRQGDPLPEEPDLLARVSHLVRINQALGTTFPHNAAMASYWISTPSRTFEDRAPLDVMMADGLPGIRRIHGHLDCTETWF